MTRPDPDPIERTVQLAGGATFTLSLPREWGDRHNLAKGDTLYFYTDDDRLVVAPSTIESGGRTVTVETDDTSIEAVVQQVKAAYTAGCERIRIVGLGSGGDGCRRAVTDTVANLVGMGVHETGDGKMHLEDRLDRDAISLDQSLVQMRQLAVGMQRDAVEAVRMNDETLARMVTERDEYVDRLFAFITRGFHRGLGDVFELSRLNVSRKTAFHYYKMARELERVADRAERIAAVARSQSSRPADSLGQEFKTLVSDATDVVTMAMNDDSDGALSAHRAVSDRLDELDARLAARCDPDAYRYGKDLLESARRTSAYGLNILNMTVEVSVLDMLYATDDEDVNDE